MNWTSLDKSTIQKMTLYSFLPKDMYEQLQKVEYEKNKRKELPLIRIDFPADGMEKSFDHRIWKLLNSQGKSVN